MNSRSQPQRFVGLGKHKILIVAFPEDQLFITLLYACADRYRVCEIEGSSFNGAELSGWNKISIYGRKSIRV